MYYTLCLCTLGEFDLIDSVASDFLQKLVTLISLRILTSESKLMSILRLESSTTIDLEIRILNLR